MGLCPKTNAFAPLILIDGETFKYQDENGNYETIEYGGKTLYRVNNPAIGYTEQSEQLVQSTRNAYGQVVAQPINRRLDKIENLTWPYLSRKSVNWLKQQIQKFEFKLGFWDDQNEHWQTRRYYWGDFKATPCEWEMVYVSEQGLYIKRPTWYKDVTCNVIDMGY